MDRSKLNAAQHPVAQQADAFAADLHALRIARAAGREHDIGQAALGQFGALARRERAGGGVVDGGGAHDLDDAAQALGRVDGIHRHERRADQQGAHQCDEALGFLVAVDGHRHIRRRTVLAGLVGPGGRVGAQLGPGQAAVGGGNGQRLGRHFRVNELEGLQVETHAETPGVRWGCDR
ncbi:hypothetical protein G6F22_015901 [Rhizopus arrhizus]|nr:hypothetical protein G6F22_015901 [Rhizopus arrhizus]